THTCTLQRVSGCQCVAHVKAVKADHLIYNIYISFIYSLTTQRCLCTDCLYLLKLAACSTYLLLRGQSAHTHSLTHTHTPSFCTSFKALSPPTSLFHHPHLFLSIFLHLLSLHLSYLNSFTFVLLFSISICP